MSRSFGLPEKRRLVLSAEEWKQKDAIDRARRNGPDEQTVNAISSTYAEIRQHWWWYHEHPACETLISLIKMQRSEVDCQ